jgi:GAF domain-containing protein
MAVPDECVRELAALAGVVLGRDDLPSTLAEICRIAVRAVPRADGASLTSFTESGPAAVAASDEWATGLDEIQFVEHEGPCLDTARTGLLFRIRDMTDERRWPFYMPRAVAHGARSMVSIPLTAENKLLGALNVYSRAADAFGSEEVSIAEIIAGHASLATQTAAALFRQRDLAEQLGEAMRFRATIEQAKGIVMAQSNVDADTAFEILRSASQRENRKLRDIAQELVDRYRDPGSHA